MLQNVVGVDIATLLLKNRDNYPCKNQNSGRRESTLSQRSAASGDDGNNHEPVVYEKIETSKQRKTVDQMTDEFRNTLLYGLVQEALGKRFSKLLLIIFVYCIM